MANPDDDSVLAARLWTMRIILVALINGLVIFLVIAVVQQSQANVAPIAEPLLTYVALGYAAVGLIVSTVVPNVVAAAQRRRVARALGASMPAEPDADEVLPPDVGLWCGVYQTRLIIGAALLEGAAFFLLTAYFIEGNILGLAGAAVLIVLLLMKFPTRAGLQRWIDRQRALLDQERIGQ